MIVSVGYVKEMGCLPEVFWRILICILPPISTHSGLVPLHNACSYGHYEVAEQLVQHMNNVNVVDLWKFTPLHEAAAKGKYEICKLLLKVSNEQRHSGIYSSLVCRSSLFHFFA